LDFQLFMAPSFRVGSLLDYRDRSKDDSLCSQAIDL
jgi:hypothetical protein